MLKKEGSYQHFKEPWQKYLTLFLILLLLWSLWLDSEQYRFFLQYEDYQNTMFSSDTWAEYQQGQWLRFANKGAWIFVLFVFFLNALFARTEKGFKKCEVILACLVLAYWILVAVVLGLSLGTRNMMLWAAVLVLYLGAFLVMVSQKEIARIT